MDKLLEILANAVKALNAIAVEIGLLRQQLAKVDKTLEKLGEPPHISIVE